MQSLNSKQAERMLNGEHTWLSVQPRHRHSHLCTCICQSDDACKALEWPTNWLVRTVYSGLGHPANTRKLAGMRECSKGEASKQKHCTHWLVTRLHKGCRSVCCWGERCGRSGREGGNLSSDRKIERLGGSRGVRRVRRGHSGAWGWLGGWAGLQELYLLPC